MTTRRAVRKKQRRKFKVGDDVTWGTGALSHEVIEVRRDGLVSKKLFVLLIVAMVLAALSSVVLTLTGHEELVRDAFRWAASSTESAVEVLGVVGIVVLLVVTA